MTVPAAGLRVTVRRGDRPGQGDLTFHQDHALVALPGLDPPQWLPRDQVPALLARVCGLAPRPATARASALVTERSTVDKLLALGAAADETAVRQTLLPARVSDAWLRRLTALATHLVAHWEVAVLADGTTTPWLEVVDAGHDGGLWSVSSAGPALRAADDESPAGESLVALTPVTTTAIWTALSTCADKPS